MQVVIDIPEESYNIIKSDLYNTFPAEMKEWGLEAIRNGTLLPKGHGDLIDVNRKITVFTYDEQYEEWGEETLTVLDALNRWADDGVTARDVIIPADKESEE